jgi:nickel transport protein
MLSARSLRGLGLLVGLGWAVAAAPALAHGVEARAVNCQAVVVEAAYGDGEPMSYAEAVVYGPDNARTPFLRGRTDRLGRVAFCPDQRGAWRVEIHDGMGHRAVRELHGRPPVAGGAPPAPSPPASGSPPGLPVHLKALVGISLVFGLAGLVALFRRRPGSAARQVEHRGS